MHILFSVNLLDSFTVRDLAGTQLFSRIDLHSLCIHHIRNLPKMQGFNMGRYRPPDTLDTSLTVTKKGTRASKLPASTPTVRFEMPFAIWCTTCPSTSSSQLIGQGVRFNAEKKKVGSYFSTPIWQFRMRHTACSGWIEIRTDPKNTEYIVIEGARKRDTGNDVVVAERDGAVLIGDDAEKERGRQDAFAAFEGKAAGKKQAQSDVKRIEELRYLKEKDWQHPDDVNARLRKEFRVGRKQREKMAEATGLLQDRMSLGIELLEATDEDVRRAGFVEFGSTDIGLEGAVTRATTKPLFLTTRETPSSKASKSSKSSLLEQELVSNTRARLDPFVASEKILDERLSLGIKRKRPTQEEETSLSVQSMTSPEAICKTQTKVATSLVDYDSEDE